jgi:hypothetical protein
MTTTSPQILRGCVTIVTLGKNGIKHVAIVTLDKSGIKHVAIVTLGKNGIKHVAIVTLGMIKCGLHFMLKSQASL